MDKEEVWVFNINSAPAAHAHLLDVEPDARQYLSRELAEIDQQYYADEYDAFGTIHRLSCRRVCCEGGKACLDKGAKK